MVTHTMATSQQQLQLLDYYSLMLRSKTNTSLKQLRIDVLENDTEIVVFTTFEFDSILRVSHRRA